MLFCQKKLSLCESVISGGLTGIHYWRDHYRYWISMSPCHRVTILQITTTPLTASFNSN